MGAWRLSQLLLKCARIEAIINQEDRAISNDIQDLPIAADERPDRRKGAGSKGVRKPSGSQPARKGGGVLVWLLVVGLMAVAVLEYWQINAVREALDQTRAELKATKKVLSTVTGEVSATGENLNKSDSAIRAELETINSEIRKLWDVSNKRNKKNISANEARLDKLEKKADQVVGKADKANAVADEMKSRVSELDQLLKVLTTEQLAASSEMTASLDKIRKQIGQLQALSSEQKKLEAQQADAVKSMDTFRVQVNRQLIQLESSLREMNKSSESELTFQ